MKVPEKLSPTKKTNLAKFGKKHFVLKNTQVIRRKPQQPFQIKRSATGFAFKLIDLLIATVCFNLFELVFLVSFVIVLTDVLSTIPIKLVLHEFQVWVVSLHWLERNTDCPDYGLQVTCVRRIVP